MSNPRIKLLTVEEMNRLRALPKFQILNEIWERFGFIGSGRPASGKDPKELDRLRQQAYQKRKREARNSSSKPPEK